uniref:Uncharacterized protein n=1 Tax=Timema cristinae TaxID=61476 RepID=A0A7R9H3A5_TIMCR|nr:unnamed protein product [Timema cristinae]
MTERERIHAENGPNRERNISHVNEQLQHRDMTMDRAVSLLTGLRDALQDIRDTGIDVILDEASNICAATSLGIDCFFEEKRAKKRKRLTLEETFRGLSSHSVVAGKKKRGPALMTKVLKKKKLRRTKKRIAPVPLVPGTRVVVETLSTSSIANVVWQAAEMRFLRGIENVTRDRIPKKALQNKEKVIRTIVRPRWMDQAEGNMEGKGADWKRVVEGPLWEDRQEWKLKELTGNAWLRDHFGKIDRNGN